MNDLSINYSELSHNVLGNMGKRTLSVAEQTADESVTGNPVFATLKTNEAQYDSVILKKTYSGMGPEIIAADQDRDRKDSAFRRLALGFSAFAEPEGAAAQKIVDIYAETGSVYGKNYAEETEILDKRHQLLGAPDAQAAIQSLHIQSVYDQALAAHTYFKTHYLDQINANASLREMSSATAIRGKLETALRDFYSLVYVMRHNAPWNNLYHDLAEVVKAAKQSKRNKINNV